MDTKAIIDSLTGIQGVKGISIMKSDGTVLDSHEISDTDNSILRWSKKTNSEASRLLNNPLVKKSITEALKQNYSTEIVDCDALYSDDGTVSQHTKSSSIYQALKYFTYSN